MASILLCAANTTEIAETLTSVQRRLTSCTHSQHSLRVTGEFPGGPGGPDQRHAPVGGERRNHTGRYGTSYTLDTDGLMPVLIIASL